MEPLKIACTNGISMYVLQVTSCNNPSVHQSDIVGMVNGTALAGASGTLTIIPVYYILYYTPIVLPPSTLYRSSI